MGSVRSWVLIKGREFVLMVVDDLIPYALCMTGLAVTSGLDGIRAFVQRARGRQASDPCSRTSRRCTVGRALDGVGDDAVLCLWLLDRWWWWW